MNRSTTHADAARQNGALSQGPVTAEGKARSSQNARKHNFFTSITALPTEDKSIFDSLLEDFTAEHQPSTPTEYHYVREMADAEFRLARIRYYAAQAQAKVMHQLPQTPATACDAFEQLAEETKTLQLCLRYERHYQRQFDSALKTLLDLRKRAASTKPTEDKQAIALRLNALEQMILGATSGELFSYPAGGDESEVEAPLQNEPIAIPPQTQYRR